MNDRNSLLTVLGAGKSKINTLTDLVSGETRFLVHRWPTSCCVLTWQRGEGAIWGLFYKTPIPFMRLHFHDLIIS